MITPVSAPGFKQETVERILKGEKTVAELSGELDIAPSVIRLSGIRLYRGRGRPLCQESGFRGRIGIFELFEMTEQLREMILAREHLGTIRKLAIATRMKTMFQDGLGKALGVTMARGPRDPVAAAHDDSVSSFLSTHRVGPGPAGMRVKM